MIEKIIPDRISLTLPTVFGEELTFLEFCGKLRAKLNESIDVVNENTANIQQNTTDIQQNTAAISRNESDIVKLNGVVNSISAQADENTIEIAKNKESISTLNTSVEALRTDKVDKIEGKGLSTNDYTNEDKTLVEETLPDYIISTDGAINTLILNKVDKIEGKGLSTNDYTNKDKEILDKLSKKFELVEQFTLTEDVTQIYRNQKPNGEAYNFNDVIMTLNIPIIAEGSTEAYGGDFLYIVNSETDIANHRVVAQGGVFKKGQAANISVRAKIEGGIVFGTYAASAGNISNKQAASTSYSNMSMLPAENITSVLFTFFGQPIFSGTTIKIYAR